MNPFPNVLDLHQHKSYYLQDLDSLLVDMVRAQHSCKDVEDVHRHDRKEGGVAALQAVALEAKQFAFAAW